MRLPTLGTTGLRREMIGELAGINQQKQINSNQFSDMKNMSTRYYPAIATRAARGEVIAELQSPHGLYWKNGLAYVDGTNLYYNGAVVAQVSDTEKTLVGMGAYICVWPDKIVYNTSSGEVTQIEKTWAQSSSATIAPVSDASTFIKITCAGINTNFQAYDSVVIAGCSQSSLNGSKVIQEIGTDYIVVIGDVTSSVTQASGLTVQKKAPDMDYITEFDNRLWGCSSANHEIYASKLGDPTNWNAFEGISTDSYAATVGSDGDFTGAVTHLGYVLFMKEDSILKVYGNKPSNIQITTMPLRGVAAGCAKSICIVNETLFYASRNNICRYDGALPSSVSDEITEEYTEAVGGQYKNKYYCSIHFEDGWRMMVYDTEKNIWDAEDHVRALYMAYGEGKLYYIDAAGRLRTVEDEDQEETVEWMLQSGDLIEGTPNRKKLVKLQLMLELESGAWADVFFQSGKEKLWTRLQTIHASDKESYMIPLIPHRATRYRYKIEGKGQVKLYGIAKYIKDGSGK